MPYLLTPYRKKLLKRIAWLALIIFILNLAFTYIARPHTKLCDEYTKEMGGGVKKFGGKNYVITLCGRGGRFNGVYEMATDDTIRLQVHSMEGSLLAERYFKTNWDANTLTRVTYGADAIVTFDNTGESSDFEKTIHMPPSWIERVRAWFP